MKNIIYPFMTMVAAAAALVSCSREETEVIEQTEFVYRFELVEGETKATLDNQGVWWEVDKDHVGIIVGDNNIEASVVENDGQKVIQFSSTDPIPSGTTIYSYYPYSMAVNSAATAQVTIPTEQEGSSVSAMPMAGIPIVLESGATNGRINFMNLGAIIEFRVYSSNSNYANETVESVTFWSDSDEQKVSGTAPINLTAVTGGDSPSAPTIALDTPSYRRATVTQSASVAANANDATPIYLVVAPGTFTSGKIVVNTNAASYTFTYTNKSFARNSIKKFSMNLGGSNVVRDAMTKTYTKVNSLSEGTYLLGAFDSSYNGVYIALLPTVTYGKKTSDAQIVDRSSSFASTDINEITTDDPTVLNCEIDLQKSGNNWLVKVRSTGMYLYCPDGNYTIGFTSDAAEAGHSASGTNCITYPTNLQFYHSGSEQGFTYYTGKGANNLRFYKLSGRSMSQTISFEGVPDGGYTWDIGENTGTYTKPNLVGVKTTVIYTSSNTNIAEVDSMSGNVSFGSKTGTVTITATAAGEDGYSSATASYQIAVSNSHAQAVTYYKASIAESGKDYIIVSNGFALVNSGDDNVPDAIAVNVSAENTIALTDTEGLLWRVTDYDGAPNYGDFTLTNNSVYLYRKTASNTTSLVCESTLSANYVPWRYDGEHLWNGNSTLYYAYYNNNNGWIIANNSKPSVTTLVFIDGPMPVLSFENADNLTYDLSAGGDFAEPTLNNPGNYDVTFDTSNHNIATVDSDGNVSINSNNVTGTVIVYARIAPNDDHQGAEASYEITVTSPHYYMRVTSIETGSKYLIVNENSNTAGKVFKPSVNNGNEFAGSENTLDATISSGIILGTEAIDGCPFEFEKTGSNYWLKTANLDPNYYLYLSYNKMAASTATPETKYAFSLTFDNDGYVTFKRSSYYLSFVSGSFKYATSASGQIALYKYVAGVPKQSQTVVFEDGSDKEWTFGVDCELNGVYDLLKLDAGASSYSTALTYNAPTPEGVAEIVEVEGVKKVKIVGAGSTTISVTAAEDATHFAATASFQLTVNKGTQAIAYNPANVEAQYDLASGSWTVALPTLDATGVKTQVAYESSNTNVATVGTNGAVALVEPITKGATATITATAQESADYNSASASFSLKVVDSHAQPSVYNKVTSDDDLDVGAKYLLVYEGTQTSTDNNKPKVFNPVLTSDGTQFAKATSSAIDVEIASNTITSDAFGDYEFTLETGYYLKAEKADKYIYPGSTTSSSQWGGSTTTYYIYAESSPSHALTISFNNGVAEMKNGSSYLVWSTSSHYFSANSAVSGQYSTGICLYKLDDGQPKARNLTFSESSLSVNIYGETTPYILSGTPTLTGKGLDDVTYAVSGDSGVASVDENSGAVTLEGGTGTVTITASAPATDDFKSGSASYTLTVTNTAPQTYTKATTLSVDDSYLIVSAEDDKLFNGKIKTGENAISIDKPTNGVISDAAGTYASYEFTFEKDGDNYYVKFKDGKYLVCDYGTNTGADTGTGLLYKDSQTDVKYPYSLSINNGAFFFKTKQETAGTDNQYIYYKTENNGSGPLSFKIGGSGSSKGIHLYKKD